MHILLQILTSINAGATALCSALFACIALVPGWLSLAFISAALGVFLLVIFKYTSNQQAIARVRDDIKADLLAVKIFKDNVAVTLKSQGRVFICSFKLLFYSIIPMMIMIIPVSLILAQMGAWYQARPAGPEDEPVTVKVTLNSSAESWPAVTLSALPAAITTVGPIRILSKKEIYWKIKPLKEGYHTLLFQAGTRQFEKQLAVGSGFMRLSPKRPGPDFADMLLYPLEKPFPDNSTIRSISIEYPARSSRIYGTDWWMLTFFIASMIFAFLCKPFIKVRI